MFQFEFMQNAFLAGIALAILCPLVGLFLVFKRYSMISDTLSHSSFAGIALGLVLGLNPILTAFIFTIIAAIVIEILRTYYKKYAELSMSIILTLSLGLAIVLVSSGKSPVKVDSFLFGSILTVSKVDLLLIGIISIITFVSIYFLYDKLLYSTFDEEGAKIAGINTKLINYLFTIMVAATISVSIRVMGILVVSSIMIIPVASAMQMKKSFKVTMFISIIFGLLDVILGLFFSYILDSAPGGTIALVSVFFLVISLIFNKKS
ncbi:MAG: metal ABC transporter permease [Sarcina sp.]